jgi:hypothetical protein
LHGGAFPALEFASPAEFGLEDSLGRWLLFPEFGYGNASAIAREDKPWVTCVAPKFLAAFTQ